MPGYCRNSVAGQVNTGFRFVCYLIVDKITYIQFHLPFI